MKKIFTLLLLGACISASAAEYITPGNGISYTPELLAEISDSGVSTEGDGVYTFSSDVIIKAPDSFSIGSAKVFKLADGVRVTLQGEYHFEASTDQRLTITRAAETDSPAGFSIQNETATPGIIANVDFLYAGLSNYSSTGFDMTDCTFAECNGRLSSSGALSLGSSGAEFNISNCSFTDCTVPAIGEGANSFCGINITDCTFINNNTSNTNKPQINITVGGDHDVVIRKCKIEGRGLNMVGGIAVGNLLNNPGNNRVVVDDCEITEHRYGLTGVGAMNMEIRGNRFVNNNHETNPMNGGSGISLSGYGRGLNAIISGNHIEKSLWGVTLIQCGDVNLGQVDNSDNPGGNVFIDNANEGVPYDLYNNGANTVYAQLNTWSVAQQTYEEIEKVIYHKEDNSALGEVIFMPAAATQGITDATVDSEQSVRYIDLQGRPVENPGSGLYIQLSRTKARMVIK